MSENPNSPPDESLPPSQPMDSASEALPQIIMVPIADLYIPTWNPRKHMDEGKLKNLMDYRKKGGRVEPILIWYGTGKAPWAVISGQRRTEADKRLGKTHIPAIRMNIPLAEAKILANTSNQNEDMHWWERYAGWMEIGQDHPDWFQTDLGAHLGVSQGTISRAQQIMTALSAAALEVIYLTQIRADDPFEIPEGVAYALTDLNNPKKVKEAGPGLVERALRVVIDLKLTEPHTKSLVKGVKAGKPPETFGAAPKETKPKAAPAISLKTIDQFIDLAEQVGFAKGRGEDPQPVQDKLKALRDSLASKGTPSSDDKGGNKTTPEETQKISQAEGLALLGRQLGKVVSWLRNLSKAPTEGTPASLEPANHGHALNTPHSAQKGNRERMIHLVKKFVEKLAKIPWKELGKMEHRIARNLAHAIVPLHAHSSRGHHNGRLGQQFGTLFRTILHGVVYCLLQFGFWWFVLTGLASWLVPALKPLAAYPFRFAAQLALVDLPVWFWSAVHNHLGPTLFILGVLIAGLYFAWQEEPLRIPLLGAALLYLIINGHRWSESFSPEPEQPSAAVSQTFIAQDLGQPKPVSRPVVETQASQTLIAQDLGQSKFVSRPIVKTQAPTPKPIMAYQPSVAFNTPASLSDSASATTLYDPKLLEQEMAALPENCIVKSFPVLTDETMPGDLAVSRLQDLTDPDKYTMMLGSGKQMIQSISPSTTNFTINYKSTDPFNLFNGPGQLNFFWEDVLYIHTDEITVLSKTPYTIYQLSLVVSDSKYAMTIQCATADGLKHLVNTLEYFIRNSRLGHDTALAGMPYLDKGIKFNNDGRVTQLWASSPADKAGVVCGEYLWSLGKNTEEPQNKKTLEAGLQSSTPQNLYTVSAAEHANLNSVQWNGQPKPIPKRTVVQL